MTRSSSIRSTRRPTTDARARRRILISDRVVDECLDYLRSQPGVEVDHCPGLGGEELVARIGDYEALIVRSGTRVTREVVDAAGRLRVIGRAGTGIDNIDVEAATERGIVVMNAPSGNTLAAAEHTLSLLLALARRIPGADRSVKAGEWRRSDFMGFELNRKTLGILGFGRIGREVAHRALAFGMHVIVYDPFVDSGLVPGAENVELDELYRRADIVSIHLPLVDSTRHLVGDDAFAAMRRGVYLINVARGGIVDEAALLAAIESGWVAGAALDVFEHEPPGQHPLLGRDEVIATPHLGAATREAQEQVALTIAEQVMEVLDGLPARNAVNLPPVTPEMSERLLPYLLLAERLGSLLGQMADGPFHSIHVRFAGEVAELDHEVIALALYKGLLTPSLGDRVNYVNCRSILKERGVEVTDAHSEDAGDFPSLIQTMLEAGSETHTVAGTFRRDGTFRLTEVDGYELDATPYGDLIVLKNPDRPGVVGRIGTILGSHSINIAYLTWGRVEKRVGTALTVINIDSPLDGAGLAELRSDPTVLWAKQVQLPASVQPD